MTPVCTPEEFLAADFPERRKLVFAQIDATPELWEQRHYKCQVSCGTAYCYAGWALTLAGERVVDTCDAFESIESEMYLLDDGAVDLTGRADAVLGFSDLNHYVYAGGNSREMLDEMIAIINEGEAMGMSPDAISEALCKHFHASPRRSRRVWVDG